MLATQAVAMCEGLVDADSQYAYHAILWGGGRSYVAAQAMTCSILPLAHNGLMHFTIVNAKLSRNHYKDTA